MIGDDRLPRVPSAPAASSAAVRAVMQGNRARNTSPEMRIRRVLHAQSLRYRVHVRPEPGLGCRADLVFRRAKVAVFIDGCYWHACPIHGRTPTTNAEYWSAKIARNVARDRRNDAVLSGHGWTVVRVWEHEDVDAAAERIKQAVERSLKVE